jgi:UDP-N-acetylglucosamine diphosphorylase / glucose-1-phosphate thymidylyltransferase / UDP-N-acetylgalactosamine diphosphorylase / glucosamine-1-phosphate N-acetyltransferase / galactosamine-1-phosphate N-acetyltransferase
MKAADLFTLPSSLEAFSAFFRPDAAPWEWVRAIGAALASVRLEIPPGMAIPAGVSIEGAVYLHPTVKLPNVCTITGPAWIGAKTEIRPGAFVRGQLIAGEGCVLGNSCEFKNALLMDGVQVPHFSYVGDSVLGNKSHLGAGVILSNLRLDQKPVRIRMPDGSRTETGLRKLGAMVGDAVEVGCNAVLQPGTILGRRALVHPLTPFGGVLPDGMVASIRTADLTLLPRQD